MLSKFCVRSCVAVCLIVFGSTSARAEIIIYTFAQPGPPAITFSVRLEARRGDASDADWEVYCWAAGQWHEPPLDWKTDTIRVSIEYGTTKPSYE